MNLPFTSVVVCVNENMKTLVKPQERTYKKSCYFGCAAVAGAAASIVTNPLDVIKTNIQCSDVEPSNLKLREMWRCENAARTNEKGVLVSNNITEVTKLIYKRHGLLGFSRGLFPLMMINIPSTALSWGTYEIIKSILI